MQMGLPDEDARFAILMKKLEALCKELQQQYKSQSVLSNSGSIRRPTETTRPALRVPKGWLDRDFKSPFAHQSSAPDMQDGLSTTERVRRLLKPESLKTAHCTCKCYAKGCVECKAVFCPVHSSHPIRQWHGQSSGSIARSSCMNL
jgi:hypothetical protein